MGDRDLSGKREEGLARAGPFNSVSILFKPHHVYSNDKLLSNKALIFFHLRFYLHFLKPFFIFLFLTFTFPLYVALTKIKHVSAEAKARNFHLVLAGWVLVLE